MAATILKLTPQTNYPQNHSFKQIDHETLELKFGSACLQLKTNGQIYLHNHNAKLILQANGDIILNSVRNIHLNSPNEDTPCQ